MPNLLIVESRKKAKLIQTMLTQEWTVIPCYGHIVQLTKEFEHQLGFKISNGKVICKYAPPDERSKKTIKTLDKAIREADRVFLATDPDREGEFISASILEVFSSLLKDKHPQRVVYREITKPAILSAIENPRSLDRALADAAQTRGALDKLWGFTLSPITHHAVPGASSAGRVQIPTLHIAADLERKITSFIPEPYFSIKVEYREGYTANYLPNNTKAAQQILDESQRDDTEADCDSPSQQISRITSEEEAKRIIAIANSNDHSILSIETEQKVREAPPPFTTAAIQQYTSSKLGLSPAETMDVLKELYESGYITYIRTDSTSISDLAIEQVRSIIQTKNPSLLPESPNTFGARKGAQEGHEAIRPSDFTLSSKELSQSVSQTCLDVYIFIWRRTVASQCTPCIVEKTKIISAAGDTRWIGTGRRIVEHGYSRFWRDITKNYELPNTLKEGTALTLDKCIQEKKQTQPPARLTEAKLVQRIERLGIGRPSTFASIMETLVARGYLKIEKRKIKVTKIGLALDSFFTGAYPEFVLPSFTAEMEKTLDQIAEGKLDWEEYLSRFCSEEYPTILKTIQNHRQSIEVHRGEEVSMRCPKCSSDMIKLRMKKPPAKGLPYFFKCESCDCVLFYSLQSQEWEEPKPRVTQNPDEPIAPGYICPKCSSPLIPQDYQKDGQTKTLLFCQNKHKRIAYFQTKDNRYFNPDYGILGESNPPKSTKPTQAKTTTKKSKKRAPIVKRS